MNESTKTLITLRVSDPELKWKLKQAAAAQKMTTSALVEMFLTEGLSRLNETQEGASNDQQ